MGHPLVPAEGRADPQSLPLSPFAEISTLDPDKNGSRRSSDSFELCGWGDEACTVHSVETMDCDSKASLRLVAPGTVYSITRPIYSPPMSHQDALQRAMFGRGFVAVSLTAMAFSTAASLGGCAAHSGHAPSVLTIDGGSYARAFDEAVALAADEGMPVALRDRDGGIIDSRPNVSGSLIEPWDWPSGSPSAAFQSTVNHERRRVRFEFLPSGFRPAPEPDTGPLPGQRTPGSVPPTEAGAVDLATYDGPLELRVWVYIERSYTPYLQRSTWTFRGRSFARNPESNRGDSKGDDVTLDPSRWTPVSRDPHMERSLLEKLREKLGDGASA
jgi:hypothetical protein